MLTYDDSEQMAQNFSPSARVVQREEGHIVRHPSGANLSIKVFAIETGSVYSMMEAILPPGGVIPLHIHENEDENNYILEGELTAHIGDQKHKAGAGSYVVAPRGVTQYFKNEGIVPCRFLTTFTPGGAEGYFKEAGALVAKCAPEKPSLAALKALQEKYRIQYM
jgi:quercetin dioxygenase-like cupin family protein